MLKKFTILGERCSGTNFLEEVMLKNFPLEITWEYGWKHWYSYGSSYPNSDDTLFIGIIRDPVQWINSFYKTPHHVPNHLKKISSFIDEEFYSVHSNSQNENTVDRNPNTSRRFTNLIELRNVKLDYLIDKMQRKVKNYILINYEDLLYNYNNVIFRIAKKINFEIKDIKDITHVKINSEKYFHAKTIFNHSHLNLPLENLAGYFCENFEISNEYRIRYYLSNLKLQEIPENNVRKHISPDAYSIVTQDSEANNVGCYLTDIKKIFKQDDYKIICIFGDMMSQNNYNSFSKCRLIESTNRRVLLKLDSSRHWSHFNEVSLNDIDFFSKKDKLMWRGTFSSGKRRFEFKEFVEKNKNENFDILNVDPGSKLNRLTIKEQLECKFLLSVEGNDVASNLKWISFSQSCVLMPIPTCVTWFMEDHLMPYVHYIPIESDFSDIEQQYSWCMANLDFCNKVALNGKEYVKKFLDLENESKIEKEVIDGYFEMTKII